MMPDSIVLTQDEQKALAAFQAEVKNRMGQMVTIPPNVLAIFRRQWAQADAECHEALLEIRRRERYISPEVRNMRFY